MNYQITNLDWHGMMTTLYSETHLNSNVPSVKRVFEQPFNFFIRMNQRESWQSVKSAFYPRLKSKRARNEQNNWIARQYFEVKPGRTRSGSPGIPVILLCLLGASLRVCPIRNGIASWIPLHYQAPQNFFKLWYQRTSLHAVHIFLLCYWCYALNFYVYSNTSKS